MTVDQSSVGGARERAHVAPSTVTLATCNGQDGDGDGARVHLEETFYILGKRNAAFVVRLTDKGLTLRRERPPREQTVCVRDMIGVRGDTAEGGAPCACRPRKRDKPDADSSAYLHVFAYELKRGRRQRTTLTLRFRSFDKYEDNAREALRWRAAIRCLMEGRAVGGPALSISNQPEKKLLILLNPKSGSGKARQLFQRRVAPVLLEAEIPFDLQVTKRADYARDYVRDQNVYAWRGLVCVGGDGILYEVVNGIFERADWKQVLEELPLAVVPCGSGNGLARTLCHLFE